MFGFFVMPFSGTNFLLTDTMNTCGLQLQLVSHCYQPSTEQSNRCPSREYEITFHIVDVDFLRQAVTVAISRCGQIKQDTFALIRDKDGKLYFEYGLFYENKIALEDFEHIEEK